MLSCRKKVHVTLFLSLTALPAASSTALTATKLDPAIQHFVIVGVRISVCRSADAAAIAVTAATVAPTFAPSGKNMRQLLVALQLLKRKNMYLVYSHTNMTACSNCK